MNLELPVLERRQGASRHATARAILGFLAVQMAVWMWTGLWNIALPFADGSFTNVLAVRISVPLWTLEFTHGLATMGRTHGAILNLVASDLRADGITFWLTAIHGATRGVFFLASSLTLRLLAKRFARPFTFWADALPGAGGSTMAPVGDRRYDRDRG